MAKEDRDGQLQGPAEDESAVHESVEDAAREGQSDPPAEPLDDAARQRIESTSTERVQSLKAARDAALSSSSAASPPMQYPTRPSMPARPMSLPVYHPPSRNAPLLESLRRMAYVLSFILGSSAVISLFWSTFILPLLHSTFSARQVIVEQQISRLTSLLDGLKALRRSRLYPSPPAVAQDTPQGEKDALIRADQKSGIEEISSRSSSSSKNGEETRQTTSPLSDISRLTAQLQTLSSALSSTSTTRTSLLSTLESYTSQLHRDIHLRSGGNRPGVGLHTLGANLSKESGGTMGLEGRGEQWDEVRKEIRAMKGLLLGRRNFAPVPGTS